MRALTFGIILLAFASIGGASPAAPAPNATPDASQVTLNEAEVRRLVLKAMADNGVPGAQVAVIGPQGTIWRSALGVRNVEQRQPMELDTLFQIGSVTKLFTATLIADMVAKGELHWSDTLGKLLPDVKMRDDVARMSIGDLVSHTARLPKDPPNRVDVDGTWRPYTRAELYAALADPKFELAPIDWNYSNFGFAILGHVVERVSRESYETMLRKRILSPLGMTQTRVAMSPSDQARLATHYWPEDKPLKARAPWKFGEIAGFGGISSNIDDLAAFARFQIAPSASPEVLDTKAVIGMRTPRILFPDWRIAVGRPWFQRHESDGTIIIEHGGEVDGHSAMIAFSPAQKVGVVVLANLGQSGAEDIARALLPEVLSAARRRSVAPDRAEGYHQTRQWADAEAAYSLLVTSDPNNGDQWFKLGRDRYELRDIAGARVALEMAGRLPEPSPQVQFYLAAIAAEQGRNDEALSHVAAALREGVEPTTFGTAGAFRALRADGRWAPLLKTVPAGKPQP